MNGYRFLSVFFLFAATSFAIDSDKPRAFKGTCGQVLLRDFHRVQLTRHCFLDDSPQICMINWKELYGKTVVLDVEDTRPRQVFAVDVRSEEELRAEDLAVYDRNGEIDKRMRLELRRAQVLNAPRAFWAVFGTHGKDGTALELGDAVALSGGRPVLTDSLSSVLQRLEQRGYPGLGAGILLVANPNIGFPPMMGLVDFITESTSEAGFAEDPGTMLLIQASPVSSHFDDRNRMNVFTFTPFRDFTVPD